MTTPAPSPLRDPYASAAIIYDFDGTLAEGNIQEHSLLPGLGISKEQFWADVKADKIKHDADEILVYMRLLLDKAQQSGHNLTRDMLAEHGAKTPLFAGLLQVDAKPGWFKRINSYADERKLKLEHYIISSGTHEMITGCPIYQEFKDVYASRFIYDDAGHATWPGVAINYTTKTQFLFRINKGIQNTWDNDEVNRWQPMEERPVPFSRMIFIGDGDTDIPAMKMTRHQGGHSVAVWDPKEWQARSARIYKLIAEDRVHFVAPADYSDGSQLDVTIKGILGRIARNNGYREP